jgi:hypothetical protein
VAHARDLYQSSLHIEAIDDAMWSMGDLANPRVTVWNDTACWLTPSDSLKTLHRYIGLMIQRFND